jgi:flagellar protein FliO/FliZ
LGGEKLKLSSVTIRAWCAALAMGVGLVCVNIPAAFAQSSPEPAAGETSILRDDPITAAERTLALEAGETGPAVLPAASSTGTILRMVLTLAVAAAAIYGVIYFIKRVSRRVETRNPFLKVLASAPLGSNRYAHIVAVGTKAWLVGAGESGINRIGEIEDKDILNALLLEDSRKSAETPSGGFLDFRALLRRLGTHIDSGVPGADNIRKRRERLRGL